MVALYLSYLMVTCHYPSWWRVLRVVVLGWTYTPLCRPYKLFRRTGFNPNWKNTNPKDCLAWFFCVVFIFQCSAYFMKGVVDRADFTLFLFLIFNIYIYHKQFLCLGFSCSTRRHVHMFWRCILFRSVFLHQKRGSIFLLLHDGHFGDHTFLQKGVSARLSPQ